MIDAAVNVVPVPRRAGIATGVLIALVFPLGWAAGALHGLHTQTRTQQVHDTVDASLARAYGKPTNVVDGSQVNAQLAGLRCGVYAHGQALAALVCR